VSEREAYFSGSQLYDPVAVLRRETEIVIVARVGMKASQRFMILTPAAEPAWAHQPLGSLSDVAWSLVAHGWHQAAPEPAGQNARAAKTLERLLRQRA
jgi:hypothetical protein